MIVNPWLVVFAATLTVVMINETRSNLKKVKARVETRGCSLKMSLKRTVKRNLAIAWFEESLLRLAPFIPIAYHVVNPLIGLVILLAVNTAFCSALRKIKWLLSEVMMIGFWMLLVPLIGVWLTYIAAMLFNLLLILCVYYIVLIRVKLLCRAQLTQRV